MASNELFQHNPGKIALTISNTETRKKEQIQKSIADTVTIYTCGPTVYDFAHIGNFRTFVAEDLLRRVIKFFGWEVKQVMNLTDVDDKTIRGAISKNITLDEYTNPFKKAFFEDLKTLNIEPVEFYPCATDFIPGMIAMVEKLMAKKLAYIGQDKSVYFALKNFPAYGKLSHLKLDDLQLGTSLSTGQDEYSKESLADFVLWKAYDPSRDGTIFWESPFGNGRPGWHLECSVMAQALLGDSIDIHAGGVDLIFPHHENEIAQSEGCTGCSFAKLWFHVEHLLIDSKKMSKSLGNFYTLRDLVKMGYTGKQIRLLLLQTHYRMQLNFTLQGLDAARHALTRIQDFIIRLETYKARTEKAPSIQEYLEDVFLKFSEEIADDLNFSGALGMLFELVRYIHSLADSENLSEEDRQNILRLLRKMDSILGIMTFEHETIPDEIQKLVQERDQVRRDRQWKRSDEIRAFLHEKGYTVEDTPQGTRVKKS